MNLEEIFKSIVGLIFAVILLGALAPIFGNANIFGLSSFLIGLAVLAIILAFLAKILDLLGGRNGFF